MSKEEAKTKIINKGPGGGFYFLTIIGAAVYFVQQADGFLDGYTCFTQGVGLAGFF